MGGTWTNSAARRRRWKADAQFHRSCTSTRTERSARRLLSRCGTRTMGSTATRCTRRMACGRFIVRCSPPIAIIRMGHGDLRITDAVRCMKTLLNADVPADEIIFIKCLFERPMSQDSRSLGCLHTSLLCVTGRVAVTSPHYPKTHRTHIKREIQEIPRRSWSRLLATMTTAHSSAFVSAIVSSVVGVVTRANFLSTSTMAPLGEAVRLTLETSSRSTVKSIGVRPSAVG